VVAFLKSKDEVFLSVSKNLKPTPKPRPKTINKNSKKITFNTFINYLT